MQSEDDLAGKSEVELLTMFRDVLLRPGLELSRQDLDEINKINAAVVKRQRMARA